MVHVYQVVMSQHHFLPSSLDTSSSIWFSSSLSSFFRVYNRIQSVIQILHTADCSPTSLSCFLSFPDWLYSDLIWNPWTQKATLHTQTMQLIIMKRMNSYLSLFFVVFLSFFSCSSSQVSAHCVSIEFCFIATTSWEWTKLTCSCCYIGQVPRIHQLCHSNLK